LGDQEGGYKSRNIIKDIAIRRVKYQNSNLKAV
jgi:hypothetical protein